MSGGRQQPVDQPGQLTGPLPDHERRLAPLLLVEGVPVLDQRVGVPPDHRHRRAQLVAGDRDEQVPGLLGRLVPAGLAERDDGRVGAGQRRGAGPDPAGRVEPVHLDLSGRR